MNIIVELLAKLYAATFKLSVTRCWQLKQVLFTGDARQSQSLIGKKLGNTQHHTHSSICIAAQGRKNAEPEGATQDACRCCN